MDMAGETHHDRAPAGFQCATLAGGCFWCLEAAFERLDGVVAVVSGYMGGHLPNPDYHSVCRGDSGHAEVVRVTFDPHALSYHDLLEVFFVIHDPTTQDRQGNDVGTQYRSAIFFHSPEQQRDAEALIRHLDRQRVFSAPIVTQIVPALDFHTAEGYHQQYFRNHSQQPYCRFVVAPKLAKLREKFASRMKPPAR
jgi:peptide-methionine (S)-S-oxide reductase